MIEWKIKVSIKKSKKKKKKEKFINDWEREAESYLEEKSRRHRSIKK